MIQWLRTHKFEAHLLTFSLMILASIGLYITGSSGITLLVWILIGVFVLANIMAMAVK